MKKLCFKKKQNAIKSIAIFTILWYYNSGKREREIPKEEQNMKRMNAKSNGYEVIDEFENNIASIVWLEIENNNIVKVIDEFGENIIKRVHVKKDGQEIKRVY